MHQIFAPQAYKESTNNCVKSAIVKSHCDITDVPMGYITVDRTNETFGVLDSEHMFVHASVSTRGDHKLHLPRATVASNTPYVDADAIYCYGGWKFFHFGHFLLECMNRMYPVLDSRYKNCKYVFTVLDMRPVPEYVYQVFDLLGVPRENILVINQTTQFRTVYVPEQSFDIWRYSSTAYARLGQKLSRAVGPGARHDKVYVSRLKLGARKTFGEELIQKIFEKNGYTVIYPEQMSIRDQIAAIKNCKYLAGLAGTALHLALFMRPGGAVIQIKRNTGADDNASTQDLINRCVGLDFVLVWASTEDVPSIHYTACPQIVGPTQYFREFLDAMNFQYSADDLVPDAGVLAQYTAALSEYKRTLDSKFVYQLKKLIIRMVGIMIPMRRWRRMARRFLERKLRYKSNITPFV